MRIVKVYNNNVVLAEAGEQEVVLIGRGIAYQKKAGDGVDEARIEKRFTIDDQKQTGKYEEALGEIPTEYFQLAGEIISLAERELDVKFYDTIFFTLTDHLHFALDRHKKGIVFRNTLLWDIKRVYEQEFATAKKALELIEDKMLIRLPEDEAGSIALHFFNARQEGSRIEDTYRIMRIVQDILNIVQYHYKMELDVNSANYNRFMIHLRFFVNALLFGSLHADENEFLFRQFRDEYPDTWQCAGKINKYIYQNLDKVITNDELLYLMVHIRRVTK